MLYARSELLKIKHFLQLAKDLRQIAQATGVRGTMYFVREAAEHPRASAYTEDGFAKYSALLARAIVVSLK